MQRRMFQRPIHPACPKLHAMTGRRRTNPRHRQAEADGDETSIHIAGTAPSPRFAAIIIGLAIVSLTLLVYARAIAGGFIWDDDSYILNNETLNRAAGLWRIWFEIGATPQYYPLVFTTFWVENQIWGHWSHGYHLVNVLLHAGTAWMLWRILRELRVPGAAAAALIFALHPVHVESVAWITERKNVLSGFFYMLAAWYFIRFSPNETSRVADANTSDSMRSTALSHRPLMNEATVPNANWKYYILSLACFILALLSKTVTASLPAALLLVYWWKTGRISRRTLIAMLPMLALGAAAGRITAWVETHHVGTKFVDLDFSAAQRVLIAGRAVWFYLWKLLWPHPLTFIYPRWRLDAASALQWAFPMAAVLLVGILVVLVRRAGRGPLTAALFFGGTLFPALGFVSVFPMRYSFVADHFQYLASIGPIVFICAGGAWLFRRMQLGSTPACVATGLACLILGILTFRQAGVYRDLVTLWVDTLKKNPDATMARNNLGAEYQRQGRLDEAITCYVESLAHPDCYDRPDVLTNLAKAWTLKGDYPRAIEYYEQALALRPDFPKARSNLGAILQRVGRAREAESHLRASVESYPENPLAWNNLGSVLLELGRAQEALDCLKKAAALRPDLPDAHYNMGNALFRLRRSEEALAAYGEAIRIDPKYVDAHVNRANVFLQSGQIERARQDLNEAIRIQPDHAIGNYHLSSILAREGRREEAQRHYTIAKRGRPDLPPPAGLTGS
ncbi:MAG: O-GlcNAc transferase [Planctomycetota bacterium]|nr:MAG: O-GlcNAc transferase [Planctomycetota bacterium]